MLRELGEVLASSRPDVLREGRKIQLCEVKLLAEGVQVVGATVLKIKSQAQLLPDDVKDLPVALPLPEERPFGFMTP